MLPLESSSISGRRLVAQNGICFAHRIREEHLLVLKKLSKNSKNISMKLGFVRNFVLFQGMAMVLQVFQRKLMVPATRGFLLSKIFSRFILFKINVLL
jgi:hypothetical protein